VARPRYARPPVSMPTATASFQHEALLYEGLDGFLAGTLPLIREGVERDEPMLVAVGAEKVGRLRDALGERAGAVRFADMAQLGRNPGRIIPAWEAFLDEHAGDGRPVRGIGEPIWAGRSGAELVECQLHESLLNVAFARAGNFRLVCPYDVAGLDAGVVHEACCSHPVVVDDGDVRPSHYYRDEDLLAPFDVPLPTPPAAAELLGFDGDGLRDVRTVVARHAAAGHSRSRAEDLVLAVSEVAANSVRHGGGQGVLRIWREDGSLVCEVRDRGQIDDPLVGRRQPGPEQLSGRGLWIAHQLCDLVQLRSGHRSTVVRLFMAAG
jgi:anti-sigma regulatory factor (Ser/Thr protein kinase)